MVSCMIAISKFIYRTEHEQIKVRNEITDFLKDSINIIEDVPIPTEYGDMTIDEYIQFMPTLGNLGSKIEIYTSQLLYNITFVHINLALIWVLKNLFINFYGIKCKIII